MSVETEGLVLIVGLPEAGKSTYLAALLHYVSENRSGSALRLAQYVGEFSALRKLEKKWLECTQFGRTLEADESLSVLPLRHDISQHDYEIVFPDLSGERIERHWRARECDSEYARLAGMCSGIILMINPEIIVDTLPLEDLPQAAAASGAALANSASQLRDWNADDSSTQVKLVDLLQTLLHLKKGRDRVRLSIVVSLWDTVASLGKGPDELVRGRLPLLYQFVAACDRFYPCYFGVSAQGADYGTHRERLLKLRPTERAIVVGPNGKGHDLTLPVVWALGGNDAKNGS